MKEKLILFLGVFIFSSHSIEGAYTLGNQGSFWSPLSFTRSGINYFFTEQFNTREYAEFLSYSGGFEHLMQFLVYGKKTGQPREYLMSVLRIFYNRAKEMPFMTAPALEEFLTKLPTVIDVQQPFVFTDWLDSQNKDVNAFVCSFIQNNLVVLPVNPTQFIDQMVDGIMNRLKENFEPESISSLEIEQMLVRLLDLIIGKVIWDVKCEQEAWNSLSRLSGLIKSLAGAGLIRKVDADDLFYSLLESFLKFLNLVGGEFSLETIATMQRDLDTQEPFWNFVEEDGQLMPIRERLSQALIATEAVIRSGMLSPEPQPYAEPIKTIELA